MAERILSVLTEAERRDFFPGARWNEVEELSDGLRQVDPAQFDAVAWRQLLAEFRPRILLAAWGTPSLPVDVAELTGGSLEYVCYLAGSVRHLVAEELINNGLLVTNWGHSISRTVAECGLMLAIATLRRVADWQLRLHVEGGWAPAEIHTGSLFERRVGLHGFGAVARELCRLLQPFDVALSAYSGGVPSEVFASHRVREVESLEALFQTNEVVFEVEALTAHTRGSVNEGMLRALPEGGAFINVGRGQVVDEAALARVAAEGRVHFGLDVFEEEPLPSDSPLRGLRNVVLLPHVAGPTRDRRCDGGDLALYNLRAFLAGHPVEARITPAVYARAT
ncbi:MAG: hydroxyacid dehydrogenase [Opitutales bacterium]